MNRVWYKESVMYALEVRSFKDGNGDGTGDFKGLLNNFDYLVKLGINCLWLLPFYKSQGRDFGYDVVDYFMVDPKLGTLDDFRQLIKKADENNIRVLVDLIVNHTSCDHPWFLEARKDKNSPYRDYYIWSKEKPADADENVVFKNVETSNWEYDEAAGEYYYHTFYSFQPDLNITNPRVREEILKIIDFWMNLGIAGFRVDAAPHMIEEKGSTRFKENPMNIFKIWKEKVLGYKKDAILLGESDVDPKDYAEYFEDGKFNGLFNFYLNNYLYYSLAAKEPKYIAKAFEKLPAQTKTTFYANFLRNHDELDLERLTESQRQKVYEVFAPEKDMRLYGRGIRRRLPPMAHNDRRILELCFSLIFSLPGMPMLLYGEEIGMGDDLRLKERNSVRTAMQWTSEKNGGFTSEKPTGRAWSVISGGEFGYENLNVKDQVSDENSWLNFVRKMIRSRYAATAFCYGSFNLLPVDHERVLAHICRLNDSFAFAVHNFSEEFVTIRLKIEGLESSQIEKLQGCCEFNFDKDAAEIKISPFGYGWWA